MSGVDLGTIRSVLIVKPSSLGDIVHTCPAVHFLKRFAPRLEISWLVNNESAPLLSENDDLSKLILFPRNEFRGFGKISKLPAWLWRISRLHPDLILDFQGLARTAFISRISGARRVHCLSDSEMSARFLASRVVPARRSDEHAIDRYLRLVADLGAPVGGKPEFNLPQGKKPEGVALPAEYILLHPFSRGAGKSFTDRSLESFCRALAPVPIIIAGKSDRPVALPENGIDLINRTSLAELIWLIRHARFVVSVDSGPMHIASALTDHLIGIHTWTDPQLVGPYNANNWVWKAGRIIAVKDLRALPADATLPESAFGEQEARAVAEFVRGIIGS